MRPELSGGDTCADTGGDKRHPPGEHCPGSEPVVTNVNPRKCRDSAIPHHIAKNDYEYNGDYSDFKQGGVGCSGGMG